MLFIRTFTSSSGQRGCRRSSEPDPGAVPVAAPLRGLWAAASACSATASASARFGGLGALEAGLSFW